MAAKRQLALVACQVRSLTPTFIPPATEDEFSTDTVDWYAVERAINGDSPRPELTRDELREAALWMRRHDIDRTAVSIHLCVYERLVKEWEAAAGMLGPDQLCTHAGCGKARAGRGLCTAHLSIDRKWRQAVAGLGMAA